MTSQAEQQVLFHYGSSKYTSYNVEIAKIIGLEESILLNDLIDEYSYFKSKNQLIELEKHDGFWFFYSHDKCYKRTAIKEKAMLRVVKSLERQQLIIYVKAGVPAKRHFKINFENVKNLSNNNSIIPKREFYNSQTGTTELPNGNCITTPNTTPNNKMFVADEPVGSPLQKIQFQNKDKKIQILDQTDIHLKIVKEKFECTTSEIEYATEALSKTKAIVYDWWRFIQGTIEKYRNIQKSRRVEQCNQKNQSSMKNYNNNFSEKDLEERPRQEYPSLQNHLNKLRNGSKNLKTL